MPTQAGGLEDPCYCKLNVLSICVVLEDGQCVYQGSFLPFSLHPMNEWPSL